MNVFVCRTCHGKSPCKISHGKAMRGACSVCGKTSERLVCPDGSADSPKDNLIRMYRHTKPVDYGGGFI